MRTNIVIGIFIVVGLFVIQAATLYNLMDAHDRIGALEVELRGYIEQEVREAVDFAASERRDLWDSTRRQFIEAGDIWESKNQAFNDTLTRIYTDLDSRIDALRNWVSNNFYGVQQR